MTHSTGTEDDRSGIRPRQSGGADGSTAANWVRRGSSAVLGGALLTRGLGRRSLRGAAMALAGGWLLSRALGWDARSRIARALRSRAPGGSDGNGGQSRGSDSEGGTISRSVTVGKPAEDLYDLWRDPDQFSRIMGDFAEITPTGDDRLRWTVRGPRGREVTWETHVAEAEPGELLRWQTPADATVPNEGSVRFSPAAGDRGTLVTLSLSFDPPGGALGDAALERLDAVPETLAGRALSRFKSLAESGEIPTLEGNPSARGEGDLL